VSVKQLLAGKAGQEAAAEQLRGALLQDILSEEAQALIRAFVGGGDKTKAFAVRSSATVEDGSDSAFAGQFTTLLNVHSVDNVTLAVKTCWASLLSDAVLPYYQRHAVTQPLMVGH